MDITGLDVHLGIQVLGNAVMQAGAVVVSKFAQIEGDDVGKTHFIGKIQFDQLVIDLEHIAAGAQGNDTASARLDTLVDDLSDLEGGLMGAVVGRLHDGRVDFFVSREGCKLNFVPRLVIPVGYLMELDIGV